MIIQVSMLCHKWDWVLRITGPDLWSHCMWVWAVIAETNVNFPECSTGHWNWGGLEKWWRYHHSIQPPTPPITTSAPPQGFTLLIDWLTPFPFQESLSGLSTQLTFPRTLPIPISMILDSQPVFPVYNLDLCVHWSLQLQSKCSIEGIQLLHW